jgi:hypothetical protein
LSVGVQGFIRIGKVGEARIAKTDIFIHGGWPKSEKGSPAESGDTGDQ